MSSHLVGYLGAGVAAVFFGSNYVPTKNYPTGDGISFVWSFSSGVLIVGIVSIWVAGKAVWAYTGLLGGSLWATGNLCVIPIVKTIGLGPGMLMWGSTSLITGFFVGKFGLFGVAKQGVQHDALNWVAILFVVAAMCVFFFIRPSVSKRDDYEALTDKMGDIQDPETVETSILDKIPNRFRNIIGAGLAILSGMLYGVNMVPMTLYNQAHKDAGTLDFVFSHFTGIFLYSSAIFFVYCIVNRPPKIYPAAILPSIISGAMWGIAQCGLMTATQILHYTVGFPIGSAGPILVSSMWSVLYFGEIRGRRNLLILGASFTLLLTGIVLLTMSNIKKL